MAKLHYIYELYKDGNLSSKYIGLSHYRRYFNFLDDIPDFDKLFENYDIILSNNFTLNITLEAQYCSGHLCKSLYDVIEILKELKPEYYNTAIESIKAKDGYFFNMFIMKKEDFFKYCEFIYDILFEYDRRHNLTSQKDNYTTFDVFSFLSNSWYRFGTVGLFRHSIWVYYDDSKPEDIALYLYIYGGFDSEYNPEINSKLFKINIFELFSKKENLKEELNEYLVLLSKKIVIKVEIKEKIILN